MFINHKGRLFALIISVLILFVATSASCQDSTHIANKDLQAAVAIIEEWRFMKLELKAKDESIAIMQKQVASRNSQIQKYKQREKTFTGLIDAYKKDSTLAAAQIRVYAGMTTSLKKDLKKQRRKTTLAIIGGIVMSGVTLYLTTR